MKYFYKSNPPEFLIEWLTAYEVALQQRYDSEKSIDSIWQTLGEALDKTELSEDEKLQAEQRKKQINEALDQSLLQEQGYICCYCGKQIPENEVFVREHFLDKSTHRKLVFQYSNLLASCEGGKVTSYSVGQKVKLHDNSEMIVRNVADVVAILKQSWQDITVDTIQNHSKNKNKSFGKGDKIYFSNPPHCDTAKGNKQEIIVNPAMHKDCEYWFIYKPEKDTIQINVQAKVQNSNKDLVNTTISVLKLDDAVLKRNKFRLSAYQLGKDMVTAMESEMVLFENEADKQKFVEDYIEHEIYAKTNGKLTPFCFVTASMVWNHFLSEHTG